MIILWYNTRNTKGMPLRIAQHTTPQRGKETQMNKVTEKRTEHEAAAQEAISTQMALVGRIEDCRSLIKEYNKASDKVAKAEGTKDAAGYAASFPVGELFQDGAWKQALKSNGKKYSAKGWTAFVEDNFEVSAATVLDWRKMYDLNQVLGSSEEHVTKAAISNALWKGLGKAEDGAGDAAERCLIMRELGADSTENAKRAAKAHGEGLTAAELENLEEVEAEEADAKAAEAKTPLGLASQRLTSFWNARQKCSDDEKAELDSLLAALQNG